ncbi:hypothetical protein M9H77_18561 [Catharanthus roseus]|uniref:Uncharacterized protein n=1 Tax=Catharanthus roseus TaxID=4058 RepID=A0ACC0B829_CATRO|nr:hypothetical protein M9H77_18561 [Catharanthus roseus]
MSNFSQFHPVSLSILQVLWIEEESVVHFSDTSSDFEGPFLRVVIRFHHPFDGKSDSVMWHRKMKDVLVQNKIAPAICTPDKYLESWTREILAEKLGYAHSCLTLHLKDHVLREINETDNAYEIWTKLEKHYLAKSLSNKIYLKE